MNTEILNEAIQLHQKINQKKKELEEKTFALNCLNSDNAGSCIINIKVKTNEKHTNYINRTTTDHPIEIAVLINVIEDSLSALQNEIDDLEYKFKKM